MLRPSPGKRREEDAGWVFAILTVLLHGAEELDDDLGRRADEDLTLALALGVDDGLEAVVLYTT